MQNKINTYTCPAGHIMVTRDVDEGVTPMMKACPTCGQPAHSGFYNVDHSLIPTHEWYKPAHPERYTNPGMRQHCESGGLAFRAIGESDETETMPVPIPPKIHELKTLPVFFVAVVEGEKSFEVRENGHNFTGGDQLNLREWEPETGYTGRSCLASVGYVLLGGQYGILPGYCVMAIWPVSLDGFEESDFPEGPEHVDGFPINTFCG